MAQSRIAVALLLLLTLAVYWQVHSFEFVYDDALYVTENPYIQDGLTWGGVKWAFTSTHAAFWHPMTWLSLMLDVSLYGTNAGGYHVTALLLHMVNTLVLLGAMRALTGTFWRSYLVAAIFALHPLHVESVAWVAERKDVLSTLFGFAALWAYAAYARQGGWKRYCLMLGLFVLSLLAKPMFVTFPFVCVLLDIWPLKRLTRFGWRDIRPCVLDKLLMFVPIVLLSALAIYSQARSNAMPNLHELPLSHRLSNATVSYIRYLYLTVWPIPLSALYPAVRWQAWQVIGSAAALLSATAGCIVLVKRAPWLLIGWLMFLGMLVPVLGIVQVGGHSIAVRYMYVPLLGLSIMFSWALGAMVDRFPKLKQPTCLGAGFLLVLWAGITWLQVGYWRNPETLFKRMLEVTGPNPVAYHQLGAEMAVQGRFVEAEQYLLACERMIQSDPSLYFRLARVRLELNRPIDALEPLERVLALQPSHHWARYMLGRLLLVTEKPKEAVAHFEYLIEQKAEMENLQELLAQAKQQTSGTTPPSAPPSSSSDPDRSGRP